jgi:hypothetical protein
MNLHLLFVAVALQNLPFSLIHQSHSYDSRSVSAPHFCSLSAYLFTDLPHTPSSF